MKRAQENLFIKQLKTELEKKMRASSTSSSETLIIVSLAARQLITVEIWVLSQERMRYLISYLLTKLANGWTCRDVPMMMRRSQRGKS